MKNEFTVIYTPYKISSIRLYRMHHGLFNFKPHLNMSNLYLYYAKHFILLYDLLNQFRFYGKKK